MMEEVVVIIIWMIFSNNSSVVDLEEGQEASVAEVVVGSNSTSILEVIHSVGEDLVATPLSTCTVVIINNKGNRSPKIYLPTLTYSTLG